MKPSEPKCVSEHDYFVLEIINQLHSQELRKYDIVKFEQPIFNKDNYIGSVDLILQSRETNEIMIIEFKPRLDKITDAVRQLKVYARYFSFSTKASKENKYRLESVPAKIAICSFESEFTYERNKICEALDVLILTIKDKETKQKKLL